MTYYILCIITYIISYPVLISYLLSCSGYTPMLYYSFLTYCFIIYFLIRSCIFIYFHFYCTVILYFPIFSSFRLMTYCIPCTITRGGKIDPTRWTSSVRPKLGPGWAIKLLAQKKPGQIWPGLVWPSPVWLDPARLA